MKHIERQEGIPTRAQVVRKGGQIDVIGRIEFALIVLYTVMSLHNHCVPNEGPKIGTKFSAQRFASLWALNLEAGDWNT